MAASLGGTSSDDPLPDKILTNPPIVRVVVTLGLVMLFRPVYPLHGILHQLDNRSAILQLLDVRNILILQLLTRFLVPVDNGKGFEEKEEHPEEIGKGWGSFEAESVDHGVRMWRQGVHAKLAFSSDNPIATGVSPRFIKEVFHTQARLVVCDPMDAFVEDDEKEGFEFV